MSSGVVISDPTKFSATDGTVRPFSLDATGALRVTGSTGGSSGGQTGSVTNPGVNGTQAQAVQGIAGGVPQPVSLTSQPLPTGAATAAKQPAIGTAGTASNDVLSVQGIVGGTPQSVVATPVGSTPLGYRQVTDVSASTALPTIPGDATVAVVIPDGAGVRVRKDGTAPTATVGMPIPVGGGVTLYGAEIAAARFIQQAAGAILNIEYAK